MPNIIFKQKGNVNDLPIIAQLEILRGATEALQRLRKVSAILGDIEVSAETLNSPPTTANIKIGLKDATNPNQGEVYSKEFSFGCGDGDIAGRICEVLIINLIIAIKERMQQVAISTRVDENAQKDTRNILVKLKRDALPVRPEDHDLSTLTLHAVTDSKRPQIAVDPCGPTAWEEVNRGHGL